MRNVVAVGIGMILFAGAALASTAGKVVETMDSGGYTYVLVDSGSAKIWAASPQFKVAVGDQVTVPDGMPMQDFHSKTLDRTFDVVYFVDAIKVGSGAAATANGALAAHGAAPAGEAEPELPPGHPVMGHSKQAATAVDLTNIKKAEGGQTVADLFANKTTLVGKEVAVRGRVVKATQQVMGKNWLHVRDGSGAEGSNDLTISTAATAAVGDMVLVKGKLAADRDLGAGYHYDIIIEDAAVTVE